MGKRILPPGMEFKVSPQYRKIDSLKAGKSAEQGIVLMPPIFSIFKAPDTRALFANACLHSISWTRALPAYLPDAKRFFLRVQQLQRVQGRAI
ncbi:hypothetical protein NIZ92_19380 [Alcaligenes sp. 1735tsa3]|uniref:hypothetical protein n=1 Tax=unclassified Alcaligenes TaxID=259357 RepID=UPI000586DA53|nr:MULTISPECIES: hypothetical protein [unclassified Alcaligenes]USY25433.1 hypothetical protein NIZ92_19380 [Alcaligenes sp. 1735tsa3]